MAQEKKESTILVLVAVEWEFGTKKNLHAFNSDEETHDATIIRHEVEEYLGDIAKEEEFKEDVTECVSTLSGGQPCSFAETDFYFEEIPYAV